MVARRLLAGGGSSAVECLRGVRVRVRLGVDTLGLGTVSKCSVLYLTVWP